MKISTKIMVVFAALLFIGAGNVFALDLGTNITIWDGVGTGSGWYGGGEDNEIAPNCVKGQQWDLEGMFLKNTMLSLVGGYDFVNGETGNNELFLPGDIFIDTNGDAAYGAANNGTGGGNATVTNTFGYEYVLDLDMTNMVYDIVKLDAQSSSVRVFYSQNAASNPWLYDAGGDIVGSGSLGYLTDLTGNDVGFLGYNGNDTHNALSADLSYFAGQDLLVHYTYGCGNDNLMGEATVPVPEPATMVMLGLSTLGLASFRRKK